MTRIRSLHQPPGNRVMGVFVMANFIGAAVVNAYLGMTAQESVTDIQEDLHRGWVLLGVYFLVSGAVLAWFASGFLSSLDWLHEGRRPREDERRMSLLLPRKFALLTMAAWIGGTIVFGIAGHLDGDDGRHVLRSGIGSLLGGLTTASILYLLVDRMLRPVFARVLAEGPTPVRTLGVRLRLVMAWWLGSGVPFLGIALSPLFPDQTAKDLAVLGWIGIVSGAVAVALASRSVSDRLASVRGALARVRTGDLRVEVPVDEAGEIGQLQAGVNEMVSGLRERTVIADLFGRHVGAEVARLALAEGVHLGGEQRDVTVLFLDVTGSTLLAATRPATEVVARLNELFSRVVAIVESEGGWVDKFEGDGVLCVFGAPAPLPDHRSAALRAARRLCDVVSSLEFGIGVSSGVVVAGNIGSESRFEYTVIGDPVNEASRLTEAAKARGCGVLAAGRTVDGAAQAERVLWAAADTIALRGRPEPTPTFEPKVSSMATVSPSSNT